MAQRVLVTAGASGIGLEIVRAFAANGASVFVCDIDSRALNMLAGEITSLKIGICDVSKRADIERFCIDVADEDRRSIGGKCSDDLPSYSGRSRSYQNSLRHRSLL